MILLFLGLLSKNLKYVKNTCTSINLKYVFKAFTNRWRNDNIFTYFFFKENKQNPEIWYCCFHFYIKLLTCIYNKSVHCIRTAFVKKRHDILVSNPADGLLFLQFFFVYLNYSKYIKLSLLISIYYSFCSVQIDIRNLSVSRQILSEIQSSQGYVI